MRRRKFIKHSLLAGVGSSMLTSCRPKMDAEYIILGGGISGLYLAWLFDKNNMDYLLLEGSQRLGGRIFTHPVLNRDVGGRGIGDRYDETMKLVNAFNIDLIDITKSMGSPSSIYINEKFYPSWTESSPNPSRLEFSNLAESAQLEFLEEWYQKPTFDFPYDEFLKERGRTEEEIKLINHTSNYNDVFETSAINAFHSRAFRKFNGSKKIFNFKGGSQAFINKVVQQLKGDLQVNKMATKIMANGQNVTIQCEDGNTYRAKKAISTLPFSTLRDIDLDVSFNQNQAKAVKELEYTKITQIHFAAKSRYWEEDEAPVSMWTDTPLERIMDMDPSPDQTALVAWVNGKGTAFFDKMNEKEIADFTLKQMAKMRPASEGKIEYLGNHNWGKYKFNKGAYCEFKVGQAGLFEDMIRPAESLHFAGEHTAKKSRGIEAACESAVRVFNELIKK